MERDDLLCLHNARLFHRLRLRLMLSSDQPCLGVFFPLNLDLSLGLPMRRAQWESNLARPQGSRWKSGGRSMCAVKGSLGHSLKERYREKVNM